MAGELERWLNKATDPSIPEEDWECIQRFCDQVNADTDGPSLAPRLLAHKIQSPQELEALRALTVLETCVNNCGERFHNEIAKFRFLNELIKVLSPKYYGIWSSEKVKSRVAEVIFSWTVWFPQEVKIRDAYQMLKKQGIVKEDPKMPEDKILPPPSPRSQNSIFDTDEEKCKGRVSPALPTELPREVLQSRSSCPEQSTAAVEGSDIIWIGSWDTSPHVPKLLARLLRSRRSEDLQAANRLIQSAVRQEQEKAAKASRRANAISEVSENVKRMDELLENYKRQEFSKSDQETLQTLFQRCEKLRPLLFRLASETADDDEALAEILQANDELTRALGRHRQAVAGHGHGGGGGSAPGPAGAAAPRRRKSYALIDFSELEAKSQSPAEQFVTVTTSRHGSSTSACLLEEDLTSLGLSNSPVEQKPAPDFGLAESAVHNGRSAVESAAGARGLQESQGRADQRPPPPGTETFPLDFSAVELPFADPAASSTADAALSSPGQEPAASWHPAVHGASLENLFVPLISITPSSVCPLTVYDRHGFKAMLHFSGEPAPGRPDVLVMVLSMLSTSAQPVKDIAFQAAVPKTMQIKLQPPSGSELPAFSPLVPPAVVSQVLLLANPHKDPIRLRYRLDFTRGAQPFSEVGEVTGFPAAALGGRS